MDPKLAYWTGAFLVLLAAVVLALLGVRRIRRRELRAHRRLMLTAASLVGLFLVSYVLKVHRLGREDVELWSRAHVALLRVHELCIAAMLGGGVYAGYRAFRFRRTLPRGAVVLPDEPASRGRVLHRRAGWVALLGGTLALASASLVLAGMYARAG